MTTTDTVAAAQKGRRTVTELTCDLTVVEHRLRGLRRWTPEGATAHLDAALANVAAALDNLHAEVTP